MDCYSRVSDQAVYRHAGTLPLTTKLAKQKLNLLGVVARSLANSPSRRNTSMSDTLQPTVSHYIWKVGRPRANWTESVLKENATHFQTSQAFVDKVCGGFKEKWRVQAIGYLRSLL